MEHLSSFQDFIKSAAHVRPSERQREWFDTEFYAFVHFSPNTYTGREWGLGDEDPAIFTPVELDCDGWVEAIKSAGMKGLIITAKHHDGFCLWPSKYTEHSIKNSPYKNGQGDIVREVEQACRRGGIKFGFYLSPWDRNSKYYGTPEYNTYYKNQLTELLTEYGEIFEVWFDGACGEGPNGRKQEYDFEGYIELIRKYQPKAVIFNGPDVRWCGNEAGSARNAEWAVVPSELCLLNHEVQTEGALMEGTLEGIEPPDLNIGALSNIMYSKGLVFCGSEIDMSIRPGWFYHPEEEPHSLDRLFTTYLNSVGANTCFILNVPPMPNGRFDPRDVERLKELGDQLRASFSHDWMLEEGVSQTNTSLSDTQCQVEIKLPEAKQIGYVVLMENIENGQRVENFQIRYRDADGVWQKAYDGTCIGHKKICPVNFTASEIRIHVTAARDAVEWRQIALY